MLRNRGSQTQAGCSRGPCNAGCFHNTVPTPGRPSSSGAWAGPCPLTGRALRTLGNPKILQIPLLLKAQPKPTDLNVSPEGRILVLTNQSAGCKATLDGRSCGRKGGCQREADTTGEKRLLTITTAGKQLTHRRVLLHVVREECHPNSGIKES